MFSWSSVMDVEELCPVCGDKVSGYHYGVLTCESCKGFFKRTVQNKKSYVCVGKQQCQIDQSQRKRCPFCRFQKCLNAGMRLEAVRADRMRGGRNKFGPMYKQDRAAKQQRKALVQASRLSPPSTHQPRTIPPSAVLPCSPPADPQNQNPSPSHWAWRLEHCNDRAAWVISPQGPSPRAITAEGQRPPVLIRCLCWDPPEQQDNTRRESGSWASVSALADQLLCSLVEWARTSIFFKELKVCDQMKLLQSCWSELLVLEIISRKVLYSTDGDQPLITGQQVELSCVISDGGPVFASLAQRGAELVEKLQMLKVDHQEFVCTKFLILFNPDVKDLEEQQFVDRVQQHVKGALMEYMMTTSSPPCSRFPCLLLCLSELRSLSILAEDYLHRRHLRGEVTCNNLLNEMLHAKCSCT